MSLFSGTPQQAPSYTTSTSETPKWMQDAIYNQIQWSQNIAAQPFQQYALPRVAELSPLQQQAYTNVQANQGAWAPAMQLAQYGTEALGRAGTAEGLKAAQADYLQPGTVGAELAAGQRLFTAAEGLNIPGAAQGALGAAQTIDPAAAAAGYLAGAQGANIPAAGSGAFSAAQGMNIPAAGQADLARATSLSGVAAAQPLLTQAGAADITGAASPYLGEASGAVRGALGQQAMAAAQPYLQGAAQSSATGVQQYMSPYQQAVADQIAKQGARNLSENLLPAVSDAFIRAGQFGGSRMGEFGARALRDTQEAVLREQAQAMQQGYGQALQASQADLARQAQLAGTAGGLAGADIQRQLEAGQQLGSLGQAAGQLTAQEAQARLATGQAAGQLTAQEQQALANIGQMRGQLTGQQMAALTNLGQAQTSAAAQQANLLAGLGQTAGQLAGQRMANLTNLGQAQGQLTAQQMQNLAALGQARIGAGQAQQQFGLGAAGAVQGAQAADYQRQAGALSQLANMAQMGQGMRAADVAALETAGGTQQAQQQRQLDAAYQQFMEQQMYPRQQLDWLSTQVRGMAPITPQTTTQQGYTTQYGPSPLSQLASGLFAYKGLTGG